MPKGVYQRAWQPDPESLPRLTMDIQRAAFVRCPDTGRKLDRHTKVFEKCLRIFAKLKR